MYEIQEGNANGKGGYQAYTMSLDESGIFSKIRTINLLGRYYLQSFNL